MDDLEHICTPIVVRVYESFGEDVPDFTAAARRSFDPHEGIGSDTPAANRVPKKTVAKRFHFFGSKKGSGGDTTSNRQKQREKQSKSQSSSSGGAGVDVGSPGTTEAPKGKRGGGIFGCFGGKKKATDENFDRI